MRVKTNLRRIYTESHYKATVIKPCRACARGRKWPGGPNRTRVSHRSREPLTIDGVQAGPSSPHLDGTGPSCKITVIKVLRCRGKGRHVAHVHEAEMARWLRLDARVTQISSSSNDWWRPSRTFFGAFRRDRTKLLNHCDQGAPVPWKRQACRACARGRNGQVAEIGRACHTDLVKF